MSKGDKTANLTLIKQKIIKTDEILQMYLKTTTELAEIKQVYQKVQLKLKQNTIENEKSSIEKECLSYKYLKLNEKYQLLFSANEKLKDEYSNLDKLYHDMCQEWNQKLHKTNQELKEWKEKCENQTVSLSPQKRARLTSPDNSIKQQKEILLLKQQCNKLKESISTVENKKEQSHNNSELQDKTNKLKELEAYTKEIDELLREKQDEINRNVSISNTKDKKINQLKKKLESETNLRKTLNSEIDKLKNVVDGLDLEISLLNGNQKGDPMQDENQSPCENPKFEGLSCLIRKDVDPNKEDLGKFTKEEMNKKMELNSAVNVGNCQLPLSDENDVPNDEFVQNILSEMRAEPIVSPLSVENKSEQHSQLKERISKRNVQKVRIRKKFRYNFMPHQPTVSYKTRKKKDNILDALKALQKANLNFIISNNSDLSSVVFNSYRAGDENSKKYFEDNLRNSLVNDCNNKKPLDKKNVSINEYLTVKNEQNDETVSESFLSPDQISVINHVPTIEIHDIITETENHFKSANIEPTNIKLVKNTKQGNAIKRTRREPTLLNKFRKASKIEKSLWNRLDINGCSGNNCLKSPAAINKKRQIISNGKGSEIRRSARLLNKTCKAMKHSQSNEMEKLDKKVILRTTTNKDLKVNCKTFKKPISTRLKKQCEIVDNNLIPVVERTNEQKCIDEEQLENIVGELTYVVDEPAEINSNPVEPELESPLEVSVTSISHSPKLPEDCKINNIYESKNIVQNNTETNVPEETINSPQKLSNTKGKKCTNKDLQNFEDTAEKSLQKKWNIHFEKLMNYSKDDVITKQISEKFSTEDPNHIALLILNKICSDRYDSAESNRTATFEPKMNTTEKVMLGFMLKLEKLYQMDIFNRFIEMCERKLLTQPSLELIDPITRIYVSILKFRKNKSRVRRLCCEMFYFADFLAIPFFFAVIRVWSEILPASSESVLFAKIWVQIILTKTQNDVGYNLKPLKSFLNKFYGYTLDKWDSNDMFEELYQQYLRSPERSSDFQIILFCKNHSDKWVYEKIQQYFVPIVEKVTNENFKATIVILIGNLSVSFKRNKQENYLALITNWLISLNTDCAPAIVKQGINLCLQRLNEHFNA